MKKETLIISFPSSTAAAELQRLAIEAGIRGAMVPVPRTMKAGCGLAWAAAPEDEAALRQCMVSQSIGCDGMAVLLYPEVF